MGRAEARLSEKPISRRRSRNTYREAVLRRDPLPLSCRPLLLLSQKNSIDDDIVVFLQTAYCNT